MTPQMIAVVEQKEKRR